MIDEPQAGSANRARLPLEHISVIDLTQARAGPTAARHLADWGAKVVTIQQVGDIKEDAAGSRESSDRQNLYRNKRMMQLDLKSAEGRAVFMRMVERADVVLENFRSDVKHRLKIGWDEVSKVNPRIVYGSISGFGQTGPYGNRAGLDPIAQGMTGLMSVTGEPGREPMRIGVAITDTTSGDLLALAVMMALVERQVTGKGRWVHTSLLETGLFLLDFQGARWLMDKELPVQAGNYHPTGTPAGSYRTSDGRIILATGGLRQWKSVAQIIGKPEWADKPEYRTSRGRTKDRATIVGAIGEALLQKPSAYWIDSFEKAGVPCGPVNNIEQAFNDPQTQHMNMAVKVNHPTYGECAMVGSPLNFHGLEKGIRIVTRAPGADTDAVLAESGYSEAEIAELRQKGVV
jgi:crotonobetainyl-CoA:carnitine CoA-transferase CaiB-like acyl-CoA transferase